MKKKLVFIIAILFTISVLMPCEVISVSADEFSDTVGEVLGDVDRDGEVTVSDALVMLRYSVGLERFTPLQKSLADINNDSRCDVLDALFTLRFSVGLESNYSLLKEKLKEAYTERILKLANKARAEKNLPPLVLDEKLCEAAQTRSEEVSFRSELAHLRSDDSDWQTVLDDYNIQWRQNGENIGTGQTPELVFDMWLNSPHHRENILNPKFNKIGIGYYFNPDSKYGYYWITDFTN